MEDNQPRGKKKDGALHLIMFSDRSKTVSLSIKRWHMWTGIGVGAGFIVFSLLSIFFVFNNHSVYSAMMAKTMEFKHAIAQYQIKYEGLYEKAYQEQEFDSLEQKNRKRPLLVADRKVAPAPADAPAIDEQGTVPGIVSLAAKAAKDAVAQEKSEVATPFPLEYEVDSLEMEGNELVLRIRVSNLQRATRRLGYIAGVALFKTEDNKYLYSPWPEKIRVDERLGKIVDITSANRYVIRAFKIEELRFPKPLTAAGKFERVDLIFSEENSGQQEFQIDVKLDF